MTQQRLAAYQARLAARGFDDAHMARCMDASWVWRNVVVAETDAEAERIAVPAFEAMQENRRHLRDRIYAEQKIRMVEEKVPPARVQVDQALIYGSPATVAARMAEIEKTGVGGVICAFRLGPMPAEVTNTSIRLFMTKVAPHFRARLAAAAE